MKHITEYSIETEGPVYPDYWQGAGLAFSDYTDLATGTGNSEKEALEDAMECLAQADWDTASNPELLAEIKEADETDLVDEMLRESADDNPGLIDADGNINYDTMDAFPYVYVTIRVK